MPKWFTQLMEIILSVRNIFMFSNSGFLLVDFYIWKYFTVHSYTRSNAPHLRRFLGDGTPISLPCNCDAYSIGWQLQGMYLCSYVRLLLDASGCTCARDAYFTEGRRKLDSLIIYLTNCIFFDRIQSWIIYKCVCLPN